MPAINSNPNEMKRNLQIRKIGRFRYWTRKGYAAFASLGKCVTIGQLRKNVTERALSKQAASGRLFVTLNLEANHHPDGPTAHEMPPATDKLLLLLLTLVRPQLETTYNEGPEGSSSYTINKSTDARNASCNFTPSTAGQKGKAHFVHLYLYIPLSTQ